jgi:DNA/RNA-binding domain of Phe-tRNA-synthetase-like protein
MNEELLVISPQWQTTYPGAAVGLLAVRGAANPEQHPELERRKVELERGLRARFAGADRSTLEALPEIQAYQAYYKRFKKTYHVLLQLDSVVFREKPVPRVAALVETMFMGELQNLLLTAVHDLNSIQPPIFLEIARGDETYTLLRGEEQACKPGDMVMVDGKGVISSVIYGPDLRTRVQPGTRRVLFAVYAPPGIGPQPVHRHLEDLRDFVQTISPQAEVEFQKVYAGSG